MDWKIEGVTLIPELNALPSVPKACEELIRGTFSTGCRTKLCSCKKAKVPCIAFCKCQTCSEPWRNTRF
jgi:hypothetical protein